VQIHLHVTLFVYQLLIRYMKQSKATTSQVELERDEL